jgi:septum formation protein
VSAAAVPRLVLASASPRRRDLLAGLGVSFEVRPADLDESLLPGEAPADYVLRLAIEKAGALARPGELVLAADTTVVLDGEVLGKPADADDAVRMLGALAGREHEVLTGVALWQPEPGRPGSPGRPGRQASAVERTRVRMAPLGEEEIRWYVATGEPMDKAGSYAVQNLGSMFVEEVFGSYTNVVGLPVPTLRRLFLELGYDLRGFRTLEALSRS